MLLALSRDPKDLDTAGYCRARAKVPAIVLQRLALHLDREVKPVPLDGEAFQLGNPLQLIVLGGAELALVLLIFAFDLKQPDGAKLAVLPDLYFPITRWLDRPNPRRSYPPACRQISQSASAPRSQ